MESIYDYEKRLGSIERHIQEDKNITESNKLQIFKFRDDCFAKNIGLARTIRYLYCLRDLSRWHKKDLLEATVEDIKALVTFVERLDTYSPRTKCEYRATLKKFYKWLKQSDNPSEVNWIKTSFKQHNHKLPSDLPTEVDIKKMLNQTANLRDRAIIICLYESGCRIGEFLKMQLKDVSFDKYGCLLDVTGKTGGRRVRVVTSSPYIMDWINRHPDKENSKSFLWTKNHTVKMLEYPALCKVLRVAARRANVKKKVNPHNFRHSRATYLASRLTEQQLKVYFGWTRSSEMAAVYVHLNGRDVNDALLKTYGIKTEEAENEISTITPIVCARCKLENESTNTYCKTCGLPLNKETAEKIIKAETDRSLADDIMNKLIQDPEIMDLIKKKLK